MRQMVIAVPGVHPARRVQTHVGLVFRVKKGFGLVGVRHIFEQKSPTGVQPFEDAERPINRCVFAVGRFCPQRFVVGANGWIFLGQREFETGKRIEVTVGEVIDDLSHRPAARAVGRVELGFGRARHFELNVSGQAADFALPLREVVLRNEFGNGKFTDWVLFVHFYGGRLDGGRLTAASTVRDLPFFS